MIKENDSFVILDFFKKYGRCMESMTKVTKLFPSVICKDGFEMSVQASQFHLCSPDTEEAEKNLDYDTVEVYLSEDIKGDTLGHLEYGINSHVFVEYIDEIINVHGGIDNEAVEKRIKERNKSE